MKVKKNIPYSPIFAEKIVLNNLSANLGKILDFGCGDGHFTQSLKKFSNLVFGCDIEKEIILRNNKLQNKIKYKLIGTNNKTGYRSNYFDAITLMGVLEHVKDERATLNEIHRILSLNGMLFIYVHNKGLFSFLDSANLKFIFPALHQFLYSIFYDKELYHREFVEKKKYGMMGDFSLGKNWHNHYSKGDLQKLLDKKFTIVNVWYYSLFLPVLLIVEFIYAAIFKKTNKLISLLIKLDNKISLDFLSYSIVLKCKKN